MNAGRNKSFLQNEQDGSQQILIGDYIVTEKIGQGSFSVVWKGRHQLTGTEVAIKDIETAKLNKKLQESLDSEIAILRRANHPNITKLVDIVRLPDRIFLILEYCAGGDLSVFIRKNGKLTEFAARYFMRQLAAGLQVLRANNLVHRDLKPQNLLLSTNDRDAILKIADFGFARPLEPKKMAETLCGSPLYMAPEILQSKKYDAKADMWSIGAILYELVCGIPPYVGDSPLQLLRNIERAEPRIPESILSSLSEHCVQLIRMLLKRNPVERVSFEEFFHHPFLDGASGRPSAGPTPRARTYGSSSLGPGMGGGLAASSIIGAPSPLPVGGVGPASRAGLPPSLARASPCPIPTRNREGMAAALALAASRPHERPMRSEGTCAPPRQSTGMSTTTSAGGGQPTGSGGGGGWGGGAAAAYNAPDAGEGRQKERTPAKVESPSEGALSSDSMEFLEREYVVVHAPGLRTSSGTFSPPTSSNALRSGSEGAALLATSPCSNLQGMTGGMGPSHLHERAVQEPAPAAAPPEEATGREDSGLSRQNPALRLSSLQRCATLVMQLANDKLDARHLVDAFAIQLVCLVIWREALGVCHSWAMAAAEGEAPEIPPEAFESGLFPPGADPELAAAAACAYVEKEFLGAVEWTDEVARIVRIEDGQLEMSDAIEMIFQTALSLGKTGAVEELMGNNASATVSYAKAAGYFYFLLEEAPHLPVQPPFVPSEADQARLKRYSDAVNLRQQHCAAGKGPPPQPLQPHVGHGRATGLRMF